MATGDVVKIICEPAEFPTLEQFMADLEACHPGGKFPEDPPFDDEGDDA